MDQVVNNWNIQLDNSNFDDLFPNIEISDHEYMYKLPSKITRTNLFDSLNVVYHKKFENKPHENSIDDRLKELNELNVPAIYLCSFDSYDLHKVPEYDTYYIKKAPDVIFRIECTDSFILAAQGNIMDKICGGNDVRKYHSSQKIIDLTSGCYALYTIQTKGTIKRIYAGYFQDKFKEAIKGYAMYDASRDRIYQLLENGYMHMYLKHLRD